ncbi:MAG: tetratricopeptide repeat protein, partial [Opitutales bacterium]
KFGTPNACNQCHQDQNATWAADWVTKWKGPQRPKEVRHPEAFHALRLGKPEAEQLLLATLRDADAPAFTRAGALLGLRAFGSAATLAESRRNLGDPDPLVRTAAISQLEQSPNNLIKRDLTPMLKDPVRSVRGEAARILSRLPPDDFSGAERNEFQTAFTELKERYLANLDRAEANLSLGILADNQEDRQAAEQHYRDAIRRERTFVPARMNLAALLNGQRRNAEAEKLLREVTQLEPSWSQVYYSLGLLIAEDPRRIPEAAAALRKATQLEDDFARAHYNLGLCLWKMGQRDAAALSLGKAGSLEPNDPWYPYQIAKMYDQIERWTDALPHAEQAAKLSFGNLEIQNFLQKVRKMAATQRR